VLVVTLSCGFGLMTAASAAPAAARTHARVITSPASGWVPKQPAAPQPEAVPSAFSRSDQTPARPAEFEEEWLLPLGGGLAGLAALSVLIMMRCRADNDDD
jgi:hypothetical protein